MAYFNKTFGYRVSGIEYAEVAAATTVPNMNIQEIDADVHVGDFFTYDFSQKQYDVVFSGGSTAIGGTGKLSYTTAWPSAATKKHN